MITCVSPRSGIASSATWRIDHRPYTAAHATARTTPALRRSEKSMMRLITASPRGHAAGLRSRLPAPTTPPGCDSLNQRGTWPRTRHARPAGGPRRFRPRCRTATRPDGATLQPSLAAIDEHKLLQAGIDQGVDWHGCGGRKRDGHLACRPACPDGARTQGCRPQDAVSGSDWRRRIEAGHHSRARPRSCPESPEQRPALACPPARISPHSRTDRRSTHTRLRSTMR